MYRISQTEYNELHSWAKDYIKSKCLIFKDGMPSPVPDYYYSWIFYLRNGLFNHEFLSAISQMFIYHAEREIDEHLDFQITGLETAATPMVAGIPLISRVFGLDINGFIVRKERKTYGLLNDTEGLILENKPVVMLDDLCNSSESLAKCYNILTSKPNLQVLPYAFTIVNKSNKGIHSEERLNTDMYLPHYIKVISPFTLDDFGLAKPSH